MHHFINKHWATLGVLVLFVAGTFATQRTFAGPGTYALVKTAIGSGGGATTNGAYTLTTTVGQPVAGRTQGGAYTLNTGFWATSDAVAPDVTPANIVDTTWRNTPLAHTFTASDADSGLFNAADAQFTLTAAAESASASNPTVVSRVVADRAGNTTVRSVSALIDTTIPLVTATQPISNAAGWYNGAVRVIFSCSDGRQSGIPAGQCVGNRVLIVEGRNQTVTGTATDRAGNVSSKVVGPIDIDRTPPIFASAIVDENGAVLAPNAAGWFNRAVVVRFTASDPKLYDGTAGSGIASQPTDVYVATNGASQVVTSTAAMDVAGNSAVGKRKGISIDALAPTVEAGLMCTGANGWCRSTATVMLTATDQVGLSGIRDVRYIVNNGAEQLAGVRQSFNVPLSSTGTAIVQAYAIDRAGNRGATNTFTIKYDAIAPSVSAIVSPLPNAAGWHRAPVTVHFDAEDTNDGSGADIASITPDVMVSTETAGQQVVGQAKDKAGNVGSTSTTVKLDMTKPLSPLATVSPAPNAAGWNTEAVTVTFATVSDDGAVRSLIATCTEQQSVLQQTAGAVVSGTCTDKADNVSLPTLVTVRVDDRTPVVAISGVDTARVYKRGAEPTPSCRTTDALSGVAQQATATITGGNAQGVGNFIVTCAGARDIAGNKAEPVTTHYYVAYNMSFSGIASRPIINQMQAGKAVEVMFSVGANVGTGLLTSAGTGVMVRDPNAVVQPVATVNASESSVRWDAARGKYVYTLKTSADWAGQRRSLVLKLDDGTQYAVDFEFTR